MFKIGDEVRVAARLTRRDFSEEARRVRCPGATGVIEQESRGHGLCYGVLHDKGGQIGFYDPDELTLLSEQGLVDEKPETVWDAIGGPDSM